MDRPLSLGVLSNNSEEECLRSGTTLRNIIIEMQSEHNGSAMYQPNCCIRNEDMMTPTLPNVSAMTCKKTARMLSFSSLLDSELEHPPWLCAWLWPCEWECECECEWECEWEEPPAEHWSWPPTAPPCVWAWLNANMPNRFTHKPMNDTYFCV